MSFKDEQDMIRDLFFFGYNRPVDKTPDVLEKLLNEKYIDRYQVNQYDGYIVTKTGYHISLIAKIL